jgi:Glycosyltransferase family 87
MGGKLSQLFKRNWQISDIAIGLLVTQICLIMWSAFQIIYLRWSPNAIISNPTWDRPYIRPAAFDQPRIVGVHYFGDFLQTFDWATLANPWTHNSWFLAQYPPLAVYLLKPLTVFPYFVAMAMYLAAIPASAFASFWLSTRGRLDKSARLALATGLGLVSSPILMAFDRGNSVGFLAILFGLFALGALKDKRWLVITTYVLMAATKIYPALLIVVFIRKRWYKEAVIAVLIGLLITFSLFAVTPGDFASTFDAFIRANSGATDTWKTTLVLGAEILLRLLHFVPDTSVTSTAWAIVNLWSAFKYLLVILLLTYSAWGKRQSLLDSLLLAGLAMVTYYPAPHNYAWTWAIPMIALLLTCQQNTDGKSEFNLSAMFKASKAQAIAIVGLMVLVLPIPLAMPGTQKSMLPFVGYITVIAVAVTLVSDSVRELVTSRGRVK